MIIHRTTEIAGSGGVELNFYTGRDAGEDVTLELPSQVGEITGPMFKFMQAGFAGIDIPAFASMLIYAQRTIDSVYTAQKNIIKRIKTDNMFPETGVMAPYFMGIQSTIFFLNKICHIFLHREAFLECQKRHIDFYVPPIKILIEKKNDDLHKAICDRLFKEKYMEELYFLLETLKDIYLSSNMFTSARAGVGQETATVCALDGADGSEPGIQYYFHNHTLRQIVMGVNDISEHVGLIGR